jgi:hypothetical protein
MVSHEQQIAIAYLIPKFIAWAERQSLQISCMGQPLNNALTSLASSVGVIRPEQIRVVEVDSLPMPDDPDLKWAALEIGLLGSNMIGMTLGYGIFVCRRQGTIRLFTHEFRHVFQYEKAGSIAAFLPVYLHQILTVGYSNAPFEADARAYERNNI